MRYPLSRWDEIATGFRFRQPYPPSFGSLAGKLHLGLDKGGRNAAFPNGIDGMPIVAPSDGTVVARFTKPEGGNTIHFLDSLGNLWRFLHLRGFASPPFALTVEGAMLGRVGSTGTSTGPHLHNDISKGSILKLNDINNFFDPEVYLRDHVSTVSPQRMIWNDIIAKFRSKFGDKENAASPRNISVIVQTSTGSRLDIVRLLDDGSVKSKKGVSFNEWAQNAIGVPISSEKADALPDL